MRISLKMKIGELLDAYPETLAVFAASGFAAGSRTELLTQLGPSLPLQTALKVRRINPRLFVELLEDRIEQTAKKPLVATEIPPEGHLDFLVYIVCPLKHLFREGLEAVLQDYRRKTGQVFNCFVPMGCGGPDPYEDIWKVADIEEFPDLVVSVGFDNLFKQSFLENYIAKGYFQAVQPQPVAPVFTASGLVDPAGWQTVYGIFPYIIMADRRKLGDLPAPQHWSDLLDPVYQKKIIIGGSLDDLSEVLLLNFYKDFGADGIKRLAANVKDAWHASKMAKTAGSGHPEGAAIYVIPWFFAETCPHRGNVTLIWPAEGALASPLYLLAKAVKLEKLRVVLDYVTGAEFGQKAAETRFPMLNPAVDNGLPANAGFKWLGWDYIRSVNLEALLEQSREIFLAAMRKEAGPCG
jgi:ABC-type Fe3+ transport system substrate-binding protein